MEKDLYGLEGAPMATNLEKMDDEFDLKFLEETNERVYTKLAHETEDFWSDLADLDGENNVFSKRQKKCEVCNKLFFQLGKHMLTHSKVKPHECQQCHQSFSQKSNLNRHIRSKHREENVKCPMCSKSFKRNDKLKAHMKIHKLRSED